MWIINKFKGAKMRVKIIKASCKDYWYAKKIGKFFGVRVLDNTNYETVDGLRIIKKDCKVVEETKPVEKPKTVFNQVVDDFENNKILVDVKYHKGLEEIVKQQQKVIAELETKSIETGRTKELEQRLLIQKAEIENLEYQLEIIKEGFTPTKEDVEGFIYKDDQLKNQKVIAEGWVTTDKDGARCYYYGKYPKRDVEVDAWDNGITNEYFEINDIMKNFDQTWEDEPIKVWIVTEEQKDQPQDVMDQLQKLTENTERLAAENSEHEEIKTAFTTSKPIEPPPPKKREYQTQVHFITKAPNGNITDFENTINYSLKGKTGAKIKYYPGTEGEHSTAMIIYKEPK